MSFLGRLEINDTVTFTANTHTPAGVATDADSPPSFRIYEDETPTPILTGSLALLDGSNTAGFYSEQVAASAANGFEVGKSYTVYITATVGGVTGTMAHHFRIGVPLATAADMQTVLEAITDGDALSATFWRDILADHSSVAGSAAAALAAAGSAGDPWIGNLPGAYPAGSAGHIIGTNLNATVGSRATQTSVDEIDVGEVDADAIADAVLSRGVSHVEATADTTSLAALILATFESSAVGTTWTIRRTDGGTFVVKTLTVDPEAEAIVGVT